MMLVPATIFLINPTQVLAQDSPSLSVSTDQSPAKELPLKAIRDSDGEIQVEDDFEIRPDNIILLTKSADFHVIPDGGVLEAVKITDEQLVTTDVAFSQDGRVIQNLASKAYLLDIIVLMENGDEYLYETVLTILEPEQKLSQVNIQNIIQNFVTKTENSDVKVIFQHGTDDNDDDEEEPSICYFKPNDSPECEPVDGQCPNDWPMNEAGNCHPGGKCPDGFERVDDDETGTCYSTKNTFHCPISNAIVLDPDDCAIYEPDFPPTPEITAEPEPEPESQNNDTSDASQDEPLDSNCGGVPCTASEKEDSWLSDGPESSPGVPIEPEPQAEEESEQEPEEETTDSEETVAEIEEGEEESETDTDTETDTESNNE